MSLLQKKQGSVEYVVPLTTGYKMINTSEGHPTLKMKSMVEKSKIYFPGTNPIIACNHELWDSTTSGFRGYDYMTSSTSPILTCGGGNGWSYLEGPQLNERLMSDKFFYAGFNSIENWYDFVSDKTKPASSYYDLTANQQTLVDYTVTNYVFESARSGFNGTYKVIFDGDITDNMKRLWANRDYSTAFNIDVYAAMDLPDGESIWGSALNVGLWQRYSANSAYSSMCSATISAASTGMTTYQADHPGYHYTATLDYFVGGASNLHIYGSSQTLKTSGFSAQIYNCVGTNMLTTGDDVEIHFRIAGRNVPGEALVRGGGRETVSTVTATVTYIATEDGVTVNPTAIGKPDIYDYDWGYINNNTGYSGGGGGYNYSVTASIPYLNKSITASKDSQTMLGASGKYYKYSTKKDVIPEYYGGCAIFSGSNLDSYYRNGNRNVFIGFKGIAIIPNASYSNYSENDSINWGCKIYKFSQNTDNFKKIGTNTYYFQDDRICKINNYAEHSAVDGSIQKTYSPIGPCFMKVNAYTYTNNNGTTAKTFSITGDISPTVLQSMNYVTPVTADWDYIIAKPSFAIKFNDNSYSSPTCTDGLTNNFGCTDELTYLKLNLPPNCVYEHPLVFNSNVEEITLGRTITAFSAMYHDSTNPMLSLTSVDFGAFTHTLVHCDSCFQGSTNLKTINLPSNSFRKLKTAAQMFEGCTSLTSEFTMYYCFSAVSSAPSMFKNCSSVSGELRLPGSFTQLEYAPSMFEGCSNITLSQNTGYYIFPALTSAPQMFKDCTSITDIPSDFISYSLPNINSMPSMFKGCTALTSDIQPLINDILAKFPSSDEIYKYGSCFSECVNVPGYSTYTAHSDTRIRAMFA